MAEIRPLDPIQKNNYGSRPAVSVSGQRKPEHDLNINQLDIDQHEVDQHVERVYVPERPRSTVNPAPRSATDNSNATGTGLTKARGPTLAPADEESGQRRTDKLHYI